MIYDTGWVYYYELWVLINVTYDIMLIVSILFHSFIILFYVQNDIVRYQLWVLINVTYAIILIVSIIFHSFIILFQVQNYIVWSINVESAVVWIWSDLIHSIMIILGRLETRIDNPCCFVPISLEEHREWMSKDLLVITF